MSDTNSMAESSRKRELCFHCNKYVSKATYYHHLSLTNSSANCGSEGDSDSSKSFTTTSTTDGSIAGAAGNELESNDVSDILSNKTIVKV